MSEALFHPAEAMPGWIKSHTQLARKSSGVITDSIQCDGGLIVRKYFSARAAGHTCYSDKWKLINIWPSLRESPLVTCPTTETTIHGDFHWLVNFNVSIIKLAVHLEMPSLMGKEFRFKAADDGLFYYRAQCKGLLFRHIKSDLEHLIWNTARYEKIFGGE